MKNVLLIKARQKSRQNPFYWELLLKLNRSPTQVVSNYTHIHEYLCRVSFLTTLDIYKDYFKSRCRWCKVLQKNNPCILWPETKIALVHHIFCRSCCVFMPRVLWPRSFLIFIVGWIEELCSQHLPQVSVLVTYRDPCIIG